MSATIEDYISQAARCLEASSNPSTLYVLAAYLHDLKAGTSVGGGDGQVCAPMPGAITDVQVSIGEVVEAGQTILLMEAMKMEMTISAPVSGTITKLTAAPGQSLATGDIIAQIEPAK